MLSVGDITKKLGLTRGQINHYVVTGLINCNTTKVGTGRWRAFTRINLLEFALVKQLVEYGFTFSEVKELMRTLREDFRPLQSESHWAEPLGQPTLAVVNRRFASVKSFPDIRLPNLLHQGSRKPRPFESILLLSLDLKVLADG